MYATSSSAFNWCSTDSPMELEGGQREQDGEPVVDRRHRRNPPADDQLVGFEQAQQHGLVVERGQRHAGLGLGRSKPLQQFVEAGVRTDIGLIEAGAGRGHQERRNAADKSTPVVRRGRKATGLSRR